MSRKDTKETLQEKTEQGGTMTRALSAAMKRIFLLRRKLSEVDLCFPLTDIRYNLNCSFSCLRVE